ncbi:reticulon-1-A-like isoform X2 [Babylonia areolata]|uniref:reticulon-1-A-like isoform X2 n=1 Tax=Babylonia areolata TaxID=304850 RepID=UPI003FD16A44
MSDFSDLSRPELQGLDQSESNNIVSDGFETLDPVGSDVYESQPQGTIPEQDEEITTTNAFGGEEPAEEDRYAAGASDNEAQSSANPLISWGDEEEESLSQPPAAVPDSQGSALDDLGFDMGALASAGAQSTTSQDPFSNPPQEREAVSSTEPVSESPQETKAAGQWLKNVDPRVLDLIYWRDVRKTGVVFGSMMLVLLSLACFSLMSVLAYLSLAILTVTLSFRVYKNIMAAVQKTNDGHPFKQYLDLDITLKEEKVSRVTQTVLQHVNRSMLELRRLFLIEDLVDSIKFGLLLWVLTYIGSWFNGMTLIILLVIAIFSLPKVYETYKVQIDNYVNMATTQLNTILAQVQSKVPFLKKKAKAQ